MLGRKALIGMIVAILGIAAVAGAGSSALAKPASKHHAKCANASKSEATQSVRRAKCRKATAGPVAEVTSLLRGIPEERERLGNPAAPVTLQYFGDLECPSCKYFEMRILPTLIKEFVRPGKLKIEFRSFKSYTPEQAVFEEQQVAALAAGQQNKLWYFVELFFYEQGRLDANGVNEGSIRGLATQVPGLNLAAWMAARSEPSLTEQVVSDEELGTSYNWESTPDFLLGTGTNPPPYHPVSSAPSAFAKAIREHLATAGG
jgi:protein-disulfide isomerase